MIIKHNTTTTETVQNPDGTTTTKETKVLTDLSALICGKITWEGSRLQVARRLEFSYVFEPRDPNLRQYVINLGETVYAYDEDGNLVFEGNVYRIERNTQQSEIQVTCYDHLFVLCRSKMTRKFTDMTAEDIAKAVCAEMGVIVGNLAETGKKISFIAQEKTGYQIIMIAYTEAAKQINAANASDPDVLFHPMMNGAALDIIKKGTLIENWQADQFTNTENSQYKESIENLIDRVMITDEQGNLTGYQSNDDWIKKYSMFQDVYKTNPNENAQEQIKAMFHGPDRSGVLDLLGDYRVKSSYSIAIQDTITQLTGKFWVKSDTHTFENGIHEMRLEIEFENIMNKEDLPNDKNTKAGSQIIGNPGNAADAAAGVQQGFAAWNGATMPSGRRGCVEAATRIGSYYSPYLKGEYEAGVASVPTLMSDAGDNVIPFDESNLEVGDCIVYDGDEHVVIYAGKGMYVGNNSSAAGGAGAVGQGGIYDIGMTPTSIIKTSHM